MKLYILLTFFCWLTVMCFGQDVSTDSLSDAQSGQWVLTHSHQKVDSIQANFYQRTDSLKKNYKSKFAKMDSAQQRLRTKLDSLTSFQLPSQNFLSGTRIDLTGTGFQNSVDSLQSAGNLSTKIKHNIDGINHLRNNTIRELNIKLQSVKDKSLGKLNDAKLPSGLSGRVSGMTQEITSFELPANELNVPSLNVKYAGDIPALNNLNVQSPTRDLGKKLKDLEGKNPDVSDLTGAGILGNYNKDVQPLPQGNLSDLKELPKAAESKAEELSGLNEVKDQTQTLDQYKDAAGKMQNPDSLKELAVQEVKHVAVNHFAGKEQVLKAAMETISGYKSKYSNVNSISEITKRPPNEMKGKPFFDRLVPGIAIQVQKKGEDVMVDFNPYAGYRFTGNITAGLGWNQRVAYTADDKVFNPAARIFGPRVFGEYKLWKGFSPRFEIETMNTTVPSLPTTPTLDPSGREWVFGAFVGIKKQYRFIKNVRGTALVMARLFNPEHKSPYADVLNVRFGFEFPMKKKAAKS